MGDKKRAIFIIILFILLLQAAALSGTARESDSFGQVKAAMRAIRRVDNLQYTYESTISYQNGNETSRVEVCSDQLTGSWRAEYFKVDADGAWMFLQQYCNGKEIFHRSGNEDFWTGNGQEENLKAPNLPELVSLDYDSNDILEETVVSEGDLKKISHNFQIDYMMDMMKQYQNAKVVDAGVDYWVDRKGVLKKKRFSLALMQPEKTERNDITEGQEEIRISIEVEVTDYNRDRIAAKVSEATEF